MAEEIIEMEDALIECMNYIKQNVMLGKLPNEKIPDCLILAEGIIDKRTTQLQGTWEEPTDKLPPRL